MVIIVYSKDEVNDFKKTKELEKQVEAKCLQKDENALSNDACFTTESSPSVLTGKININTATLDELKELPGIGDIKANNIINYRNNNGLFNSIDDLKKVEGIGDNLYAQIETFITVE